MGSSLVQVKKVYGPLRGSEVVAAPGDIVKLSDFLGNLGDLGEASRISLLQRGPNVRYAAELTGAFKKLAGF
jgi:hypothetical protein